MIFMLGSLVGRVAHTKAYGSLCVRTTQTLFLGVAARAMEAPIDSAKVPFVTARVRLPVTRGAFLYPTVAVAALVVLAGLTNQTFTKNGHFANSLPTSTSTPTTPRKRSPMGPNSTRTTNAKSIIPHGTLVLLINERVVTKVVLLAHLVTREQRVSFLVPNLALLSFLNLVAKKFPIVVGLSFHGA